MIDKIIIILLVVDIVLNIHRLVNMNNPANNKRYVGLLIYIGELMKKFPKMQDDLTKLRNAVIYNQDILKGKK